MLHKLPLPEWVDDEERMLQVCREVRDVGMAALDTETTGKDEWTKDFILFWSMSTGLHNRWCFSRRMLDIFAKELALDPNITWLMSNANFDRCMLVNSGVPNLAGPVHCTLVMDWMHDENKRHGLKVTAKRYLKLDMNEFKSVFKKKRGETYQDTLIRIMKENPDAAIDYASMDAWASWGVWDHLRKKLEREKTVTGLTMWDLYKNIEVPFSKVLYYNIRNGVLVNRDRLEEIKVPITKKMEECLFRFYKLAGEEINLNSPKQLVELFINKLGKEPRKWTQGGESGARQPSVDAGVLGEWAREGDQHAQLLLEYRALEKVRGTYVEGMLKRASDQGRIHPSINQHITVTGRLSSSNPNLQNIPRPDDDIWNLRGAFVPEPGYTLVAIDYRQLEMRLLAHISGDENMRGVIHKGWDIHAGTAALMYDQPYEDIQEAKYMKGWLSEDEVPKEKWPAWIGDLCGYRQDAKAVGFGINYGEGIRALAEKLGISMKEAERRREKYFEPYPKVRSFIEKTHEYCRENLMVHTILGRKRRLPEANSDWKEGFLRRDGKWVPERPGKMAARALRQDVNARIQGSAADVARLAQILTEPRVMNELGLSNRRTEVMEKIGIKQLLQVHDEIVFEVPTESLQEGIRALSESMEKPFLYMPEMLGLDFTELSIPLDVDAGHGSSWSQAH